MSVVVVSMVKNEADAYLGSALDVWTSFADEVLVMDDRSTDGTRKLLETAGVTILDPPPDTGGRGWGIEWRKRKACWDAAVETGCDWIMVQDADHCPTEDPTPLFTDRHYSIAWYTFDLWTPTEYRTDGQWRAMKRPWVWALRSQQLDEPMWPESRVHSGHFPLNARYDPVLRAPKPHAILHYAYLDPADRFEKWERYSSVLDSLSQQAAQHADSILDPSPTLAPLPLTPTHTLERRQKPGNGPRTDKDAKEAP